ncbi:hypothetical protein [Scytonema sp. PCC 10023]
MPDPSATPDVLTQRIFTVSDEANFIRKSYCGEVKFPADGKTDG